MDSTEHHHKAHTDLLAEAERLRAQTVALRDRAHAHAQTTATYAAHQLRANLRATARLLDEMADELDAGTYDAARALDDLDALDAGNLRADLVAYIETQEAATHAN
jgi:hypothetical protein